MSRKNTPVFREEQGFPHRRIRIQLAILPAAFLLLALWQVVLGRSAGSHSLSDANVVGWTVFLWLVYLRMITARLVTEVSSGKLSISMRGLWRIRTVDLSEITDVELVNFDPLKDYGGYGFRSTPRGKAYLANGTRGVRLTLRKGAALVIGSQCPEKLAAAISRPESRG